MSAFRKSFQQLLSGTILAQAIGFLTLPVLARIYSPEDFGIYQLYLIITSFLLVIVSWRYEIALLHASDGNELHSVKLLCLSLCGLTALVVAVIVWPASLFSNLVSEDLQLVFWMLPFGVLFGGIYQAISYVQLREGNFRSVSLCKIVQSTSHTISSVGLGKLGLYSSGLLIAEFLSKAAGIVAWIFPRRQMRWRRAELPKIEDVKATAVKFKQYPMITATGGLINCAGGSITAGLMFSTFGAFESGQYSLVERFISLPIGILGGMLSQVYTAKLSSEIRNRSVEVQSSFRSMTRNTFLVALPVFTVLYFLVPHIFVIGFGEEWRTAGLFAQIMCPLFLFQFVMCPINMTLLILEKQKTQFIWEVTRLAVLCAGWFFIRQMHWSSMSAITFHVLANVGMIVAFVFIADQYSKQMATNSVA